MGARPDLSPAPMAQMTVERCAGDLLNACELGRRNRMPDDVVNVTLLPSAGVFAMLSGRNDG